MCCTSPELRSASSYGHFTVANDFWSQCHIFRGWTLVDIERRLYTVVCIGRFESESRPAGAFLAKYFISCESNVACKFPTKKETNVPELFKSGFDSVEM